MAKRRYVDDVNTASSKSKAARFNAHTIKRLQATMCNDPEIDLTTQMPMDYSSRLTDMRSEDTSGELD